MEITFIKPSVDYMVERILDFQSENVPNFWSEPLYSFYPQLDRAYAAELSFPERMSYIERTMRNIYAELEDTFDEKLVMYSKRWAEYKEQITGALSDAFGIDCTSIFNDIRCNISLNPIEPRFLKEHSFDIFYMNSESGAIGECIHEIIHFIWFYVWNKVFQDSYDEYENPSLKWIFSEMVVESIMRDERLSSINPYFPRENGGCIYPYFFTMRTSDGLALDILDKMYREKDIRAFMKDGYEWCKLHENEIRSHIEQAEQ